MLEKPVISNTSPLVCLSELDLLYLLRELYTEVWIPEEVKNEFLAKAETDRQAVLDNSPWIRTVRLRRSPSEPPFIGMDPGEAAVLTLAEEYPPQIILLDDLDARRYAKRIGLPVTGTVGILVTAKQKGLINTIKPLLIALQENGARLSVSLINDMLKQANEEAE